jgi:hypothetical protein
MHTPRAARRLFVNTFIWLRTPAAAAVNILPKKAIKEQFGNIMLLFIMAARITYHPGPRQFAYTQTEKKYFGVCCVCVDFPRGVIVGGSNRCAGNYCLGKYARLQHSAHMKISPFGPDHKGSRSFTICMTIKKRARREEIFGLGERLIMIGVIDSTLVCA